MSRSVLFLFIFSFFYSVSFASNNTTDIVPLISQMRDYVGKNLDITMGKVKVEEFSADQMCMWLSKVHGCATIPARYDVKNKRIVINKEFFNEIDKFASPQTKQASWEYMIVHELSHYVSDLFIHDDSLLDFVKTDDKDSKLKKQILTEGFAEYLTENFFNTYDYDISPIRDSKNGGDYSLIYRYGEDFFFKRYHSDIKAAINGLKTLLSSKTSVYEIIGKSADFSQSAKSLIPVKQVKPNLKSDCKVVTNASMSAAELFQFLARNFVADKSTEVFYKQILSGFHTKITCDDSEVNYYTFEFEKDITKNWDARLLSGISTHTQSEKYSNQKAFSVSELKSTDNDFMQDKITYFYHPLAFSMRIKLFPNEFPVPLSHKIIIAFKQKNKLFLSIRYADDFNNIVLCQPDIKKTYKALKKICQQFEN